MWELNEGAIFRFRCHTGHGYTPDILLKEQNGKLEAALWSAVRVLRERAALYRQLADKISKRGLQNAAERYLSKATEEDGKSFEIEGLLGKAVESQSDASWPRSGFSKQDIDLATKEATQKTSGADS